MTELDTDPIIDAHVHIVGDGSSGSGCWVRTSGYYRLLARFMLSHIGLPQSALNGDLDRLYLERLLDFIRTSSIAKAVILAQENTYDDGGRLAEGFGSAYVPNSYVISLAAKHPELLPAVSIHPGRADALDELERCLSGGAVMLKLLPNCQNVNYSDKRFLPFWQRMADSGLPLLSHTGGEKTLPQWNAAYADPALLETVLDCGVTVIAAHSGTRSFLDPDYFDTFAGLARRYPNLYGDISALNHPVRIYGLVRLLREPDLLERTVHGSDFPVPVHGHWAWMRALISRDVLKRCGANPNVLERDYQLKSAMGLPPAVFTRVGKLLRRSIFNT
jgi:predicted TIM-barrel fold metal-dependent hydrolase